MTTPKTNEEIKTLHNRRLVDMQRANDDEDTYPEHTVDKMLNEARASERAIYTKELEEQMLKAKVHLVEMGIDVQVPESWGIAKQKAAYDKGYVEGKATQKAEDIAKLEKRLTELENFLKKQTTMGCLHPTTPFIIRAYIEAIAKLKE